MIKKTKSGLVMDSVWVVTVKEYSLTEKELLKVQIGSFQYLKETCGNCSFRNRTHPISLEAVSPEGDSFWICDKCAEKNAPELFKKMIKERRIFESKVLYRRGSKNGSDGPAARPSRERYMKGVFIMEMVEKIKNEKGLLFVVAEHTELKKKGSKYIGLCPFHDEDEPSFTVNVEKQLFSCFGCGVGGDIITFVMGKFFLNFPESVAMLAEKFGIESEASLKKEPDSVDKEETLEALEKIKEFILK